MKRTWNELEGFGKLNEDNLQLIKIHGPEYRGINISQLIEPAVLRDGETDICVLEMDYDNLEVVHIFVSETVYFCPYCGAIGENSPSIVGGWKPQEVVDYSIVSIAEPCGICEALIKLSIDDHPDFVFPDDCETEEEVIEQICRDVLSVENFSLNNYYRDPFEG